MVSAVWIFRNSVDIVVIASIMISFYVACRNKQE